MDEVTPDHLRRTSPSLTSAIRRARVDEAERSDAVSQVRGAEVARLDLLQEALQPVLAQVPEHIDLFDLGVVPGDRPRLFVDMIGFVEMGRDRRTYRFLQDTRHGRVLIVESGSIEAMSGAIAGYIARRLVEREKALAADSTIEDIVKHHLDDVAAASPEADGRVSAAPAASTPLRPKRARARRLGMAILIHVIEYLGVVALLGLLLAGGIFVYHLAWDWSAGR